MFAQPLCQAYFLNAKPLFFVLLMLAVGQEGKLYLRTRQETGRHDGFKGHGGNCTLLHVFPCAKLDRGRTNFWTCSIQLSWDEEVCRSFHLCHFVEGQGYRDIADLNLGRVYIYIVSCLQHTGAGNACT